MQSKTTIRSYGWLAVAGCFAAGTAYVLFDGVLKGEQPIGTEHVLTALALLGAISAGHSVVQQIRSRRVMLAIGMLILAISSTLYVAVMSGKRLGGSLLETSSRINATNAARTTAAGDLSAARAALAEATQAAVRECRSGRGPRCKGAEGPLAVAGETLRLTQQRVDSLGPAEVADANFKRLAESITQLGWFAASVDEMERRLVLLLPWLSVLIAELGTIVSLSAALGHRRVIVNSPTVTTTGETVTTTGETVTTTGETVTPAGVTVTDGVIVTETDSTVVAFPGLRLDRHRVLNAIEDGGGTLSVSELAEVLGVSRAQATRLWQSVSTQLEVETDGRRKLLRIKQ